MIYVIKGFLFFTIMSSLPFNVCAQNSLAVNACVHDSIYNAFGMTYLKISFIMPNDTSFIRTRSSYNIVQIRTQNNEWANVPLNEHIIAGMETDVMTANTEILKYLDLFPLYVKYSDNYRILFEQGGTIDFRYGFYIIDTTESKQYIFSNTLSLNIPPLSTTDAEAFNYLLQQMTEFSELSGFTSIYDDPTSSSILPVYEELIQNYPNTILSQIAKARLAFYKCADHNFETLPPDIKAQVQQTYDELSPSSLIPVKTILQYLQECLAN